MAENDTISGSLFQVFYIKLVDDTVLRVSVVVHKVLMCLAKSIVDIYACASTEIIEPYISCHACYRFSASDPHLNVTFPEDVDLSILSARW